jgi:phosphoserine phosphatase
MNHTQPNSRRRYKQLIDLLETHHADVLDRLNDRYYTLEDAILTIAATLRNLGWQLAMISAALGVITTNTNPPPTAPNNPTLTV